MGWVGSGSPGAGGVGAGCIWMVVSGLLVL